MLSHLQMGSSMIIHNANLDFRESFWQLTSTTQLNEKYRIDNNLKYLKYAPLEILKKIFIQYRFFTHYYITDLALLLSKLPQGKLKSILAEILCEELGNGEETSAHPKLYDDFLLSIGITVEELKVPDAKCIKILENIQQSLLNHSWAYGVGLRGMGGECLCQIYLSTMHAYFSQNFAIINIQNNIAWSFWDIHIGETDLHHQKIMRNAIDEILVSQPQISNDLLNGYLESKVAWDTFWAQIFKAARNNHHSNEVNYATLTTR
jgi:hypothetical protein